MPNADGSALLWDQNEKFYEYIPWLEYLITTYLKPWGYTLNGKVTWQGEHMDDRGQITVKNNRVSSKRLK
ncbi:MAG: hypothetical protein ACTHU0_21910 [Kofleriaceae bacterium]